MPLRFPPSVPPRGRGFPPSVPPRGRGFPPSFPPGGLWEGSLDARGKRFAIVASRFNEFVVQGLLTGALETLERLGAAREDIAVARVPGAFEIPGTARRLQKSGLFDAVICLGAVVRGETPHFDYVAGEAARGVARLSARGPVPVIFGILTTETVEQAVDRAGAKAGNKGSEAALAAVEMANLYPLLPGKQKEPEDGDEGPPDRDERLTEKEPEKDERAGGKGRRLAEKETGRAGGKDGGLPAREETARKKSRPAAAGPGRRARRRP